MIEQFLIALLKAGLPLFLISLLILFWINKRSKKSFEEILSQSENKDVSEEDLQNNDKKEDFLHGKWVQFGGGFYGMVGLLTYLIVEWNELVSLVSDFSKIEFTFGNLISEIIVKFLIESILNLITALTWPIYWMGKISGTSIWLSLIAAYLGYWAAETFLRNYLKNK